jgi:glycosyltransferase involved in cell wall biosynthesis
MKILEICPYSAGICGVFSRAFEEAKRLSDRGHDVMIFSSNFEKGTNKKVKLEDNLGKIKIKRFKAKKLGGESFMYFDFIKDGLEFQPDVIIAHNYRHFHTTRALKLVKILKKKYKKKVKIFLVTHAPFPEGNITRSFLSKLSVGFYDNIIGPMTINKFDKILTISKWEEPFLFKSGAKSEKIHYIPNGIPEEFFTQKKSKEENKILFLGRIAPKKRLETLIRAIPHINDKKIKIEIVGPREKEYFNKIKKIINETGTEERVIISKPIFNIKDKIRKIDSCKIYILPSRVEGMPQSLIEAMARKKIVIGSKSLAITDLIKDNKTGLLFEFDDHISLADKINIALEKDNRKIRENGYKSVLKYNWDKVIREIEKTIK